MVAPTMDFEVLQNAFPSFRLKINIFLSQKIKKGIYKSALLCYTLWQKVHRRYFLVQNALFRESYYR